MSVTLAAVRRPHYNPRAMSSDGAPAERIFTLRFAALWTFAFVTFFSAFQLLPVIPFRILELGGSKAEAGWFLAVYTFASAFAAPVMGSIADRAGRQRTLVAASLLFIVFSAAYGVLHNLAALLIVGAIHGAIWSAILASSSAIMSGFIPESRRTQGMAWWGMASTGAVAIAPAVGLAIFEAFGWLVLCGEMAALSALMAIAARLLPDTEHERPTAPPTLADAWDWRVTRTALSLTAAAFGYGGVTSYAAILARERHISPESIYFTVFAISLIVIRLFTSHLGDRWGAKAILYPSLAAVPVAFAILALATERWQLITSAVIFGFGFGWMYPAFITFILGATDESRRARTFGSIVWAFDSGIGIGSFAIGAMAERWSLRTAFLVAAGVAVLSIPIFTAMSRKMDGAGGEHLVPRE